MIFRHQVLEGIRNKTITVAFRRWRRPTVRSGGTLLTAVGELSIASVDRIDADAITAADARRAGYPSRDALLADLDRRPEGDVYRIEFGALRADPRVALRASTAMASEEVEQLRNRLVRLDGSSGVGPWTRRTLELIESHPGVRAGDLCLLARQEKLPFKSNVRKLKNLGLTESLEVGYRLSPRGRAFLDCIRLR
jgi:hypothetical protein